MGGSSWDDQGRGGMDDEAPGGQARHRFRGRRRHRQRPGDATFSPGCWKASASARSSRRPPPGWRAASGGCSAGSTTAAKWSLTGARGARWSREAAACCRPASSTCSGSFDRGEVVSVLDPERRRIAAGIVNYGFRRPGQDQGLAVERDRAARRPALRRRGRPPQQHGGPVGRRESDGNRDHDDDRPGTHRRRRSHGVTSRWAGFRAASRTARWPASRPSWYPARPRYWPPTRRTWQRDATERSHGRRPGPSSHYVRNAARHGRAE